MRQWMVDPKIMCRKHLLGEHVEHHMFIGSINRGKSLTGHLRLNQLEPRSLLQRHEDLVNEMRSRGYRHVSPLPKFSVENQPDVMIDRVASLTDLLRRCINCRALYDKHNK